MKTRKNKIDARVKSYLNKNNEQLYMFQLYLGTDPLTGKKKRTTRRGFKTAREADIALKRLEVSLSQEQVIGETRRAKFEEIYDLWFESYKRKVKESTWASTKLIFKVHILPAFCEMFIDKIDVTTCQKQVNKWAEDSPKNFKKYKNYTSNIFQHAMTLELIHKNPMQIITIPRGEELQKDVKIVPYFDKEELLLFLEAAKNENPFAYAFFHLLAFTGIRKGEALALTWQDINFNERLLTINKTVARGDNKLYISTTKTIAGNRIISLDQNTLNILKDWRSIQRKEMKYFNINVLSLEQLVFPNDKNELNNPTNTKRWLNPILEKYKLKYVSTHGFRHTHASLLAESGADLKEIQARLGHADIQTTANIYTHVTKAKRDATADRLASFMNEG
ncbi:site-specific recombinase, phage integrase family [Enterococcus faecalis 06-MB-DW-09]|nr:site-specific recombinase, phage integrase family [Enterococcus faecalis 06-MB-DW-09]